jgi:clan AA aspartic protease
MITGTVNARREAIIHIAVQGKQDQVRDVEAVIDTGYTGFLILPPQIVEELELTYLGRMKCTLANGAKEDFDVFSATVIWDGQERLIEVDVTNTDPLVGMLLLNGYELRVEVTPGGTVTIETLQPSSN